MRHSPELPSPDEYASSLQQELYQTPDEKLDACLSLADLIDDIAMTDTNVGSDQVGYAEADNRGVYIDRAFQFIEADVYGWTWPLTEKVFNITYTRDKADLTIEKYRLEIDTTVHQINTSQKPIRNIFEMTFYGSERASVVATVEASDLVNLNDSDYSTRQTTPYDQDRLFDELALLDSYIRAPQTEDRLINSIA